MSLALVESFLSIQGEGKFSGRLAIFLRFFGCNLNCKGFGVSEISPKTGKILQGCDTIRAVNPDFEAKIIKNENELLSIVENYSKNLKQKAIIVITGGEPLLHHKNEIFLKFINALISRSYEVHFESNATIFIDFSRYEIYKNCYFALSVKLENSGESRAKRINEKALIAIKQNAKDSFYKFVLTGSDDEKRQIDEILSICDNDVWCMPLGANKAELEKNALKVANFAIKYGFNYSERVHIRLWDKKEGV
ncbi:MAG: 7-carboxy-7-deazaguanine synthase QueE [Campylobacter sp.]|nr:7-carboxy-7-deazaguanine synthase QueE [Campylobacter sp.]